jgi:hypothetical protein
VVDDRLVHKNDRRARNARPTSHSIDRATKADKKRLPLEAESPEFTTSSRYSALPVHMVRAKNVRWGPTLSTAGIPKRRGSVNVFAVIQSFRSGAPRSLEVSLIEVLLIVRQVLHAG